VRKPPTPQPGKQLVSVPGEARIGAGLYYDSFDSLIRMKDRSA